MYKFSKNRQIELTDFNQPLGMKLNPENRWVKKADMIPWNACQTFEGNIRLAEDTEGVWLLRP